MRRNFQCPSEFQSSRTSSLWDPASTLSLGAQPKLWNQLNTFGLIWYGCPRVAQCTAGPYVIVLIMFIALVARLFSCCGQVAWIKSRELWVSWKEWANNCTEKHVFSKLCQFHADIWSRFEKIMYFVHAVYSEMWVCFTPSPFLNYTMAHQRVWQAPVEWIVILDFTQVVWWTATIFSTQKD